MDPGESSDYHDLSAAVEAVLPYMDSVSVLQLQMLEFPRLSSQAQGAIMSLSQIRTLDIFGVTFRSIEEMLAPFQGVTVLRLFSIKIGIGLWSYSNLALPATIWPLPFPLPPLTTMSSLACLEMYVGGDCYGLLSTSRYIPAQNINTLSFGISALHYAPMIGAFIKASGAKLKHLRLYLLSNELGPLDGLSLAENVNLAMVEISSLNFYKDMWHLHKLMPTIPHTSHVKIEVWININEDAGVIEDFGSADLETFFPRYPGMSLSLLLTPRRIGVPSADQDLNAPWLIQFIEAKLPEISRRGLVHISAGW
ncbi:hypothetical protein DXG01_012289 [Tephrocybe rancida]|nr:hypothetical protein DXG01_012289 [Tephrocybe rancida]